MGKPLYYDKKDVADRVKQWVEEFHREVNDEKQEY